MACSAKYAWGEMKQLLSDELPRYTAATETGDWGNLWKIEKIFFATEEFSPRLQKFLIRLRLLDEVGNWVKQLLKTATAKSDSVFLCVCVCVLCVYVLCVYVLVYALLLFLLSACQIPSEVCVLYKNRTNAFCTAIRLTAKLVGLVSAEAELRRAREIEREGESDWENLLKSKL